MKKYGCIMRRLRKEREKILASAITTVITKWWWTLKAVTQQIKTYWSEAKIIIILAKLQPMHMSWRTNLNQKLNIRLIQEIFRSCHLPKVLTEINKNKQKITAFKVETIREIPTFWIKSKRTFIVNQLETSYCWS